jgi:NAD(P)-dependent dehydrogenase (short-subunit alcohol dehydrogenase family)
MKNTVALVTGGAGHIGRETCEKLASQGCHIAILDKDKKAAEKLADELGKLPGCEASAIHADIMEPSAFGEVHEQIKDCFGRLDFLVNCAAFYDETPGGGVPFEEESYEAWMKVVRVNMLAPFFLSQVLYPLLKKSGCAAIVNVSSIYGLVGPDYSLYEGTEMTNPAAYGASKGGLQQITTWLSTVLAPEVRVNTVTPGGVERGQDAGFRRRYEARTPLRRMATEEDVADAILYLLSPQAKYITGHNLVVDGGWTAW